MNITEIIEVWYKKVKAFANINLSMSAIKEASELYNKAYLKISTDQIRPAVPYNRFISEISDQCYNYISNIIIDGVIRNIYRYRK